MSINEWGTKEWNEAHFPSDQLDIDGDTWGFRWRGMEKMRHGTYLAALRNILQEENEQKILDIGCALCDFTQRAWKLNKDNRFYGMDISENAINWSKKKFPEFDLKVGALPQIPFDLKFDVIFCLEVLCYLDTSGRKETMKSISQALTSRGTLIFSGVLDGGEIHHTEEEVLSLISTEFEIDKVFYNYWSIYWKLIQFPLEGFMSRLQTMKGNINLNNTEFENLMRNSKLLKRIVLKGLRFANPLSTAILSSLARILKLIISSRLIALIFNEFSKIVMEKNKADEIVVIAGKKKS